MKNIIEKLKKDIPLTNDGPDVGRITDVQILETANGHPCIQLEIETNLSGFLVKRYHPTTPAAIKHLKKELSSIGFTLSSWDDLHYLADVITGILVNVLVQDDGKKIFISELK